MCSLKMTYEDNCTSSSNILLLYTVSNLMYSGSPAVCQRYLDEVHEQRRLEHPVQPHVAVGQQVGQTSPRTVFHSQSKDPWVQEETQVQVQVFVSHLPQLERKHTYKHTWLCSSPMSLSVSVRSLLIFPLCLIVKKTTINTIQTIQINIIIQIKNLSWI